MLLRTKNYSLLPHNTFGLDVKADMFIEFSTEEEIRDLLNSGEIQNTKYLIIGAGSNLLFTKDYHGSIIHSAIQGIRLVKETKDEVWLRVGSGIVWDDFVAYCVKHNWGGAENLSLIPGEVGASAIQNIGAYGMEVKELIHEVEAMEIETGTSQIFTNSECNYAYRRSIFKEKLRGKYIITYVTYRLQKYPRLNLSYAGLKNALPKDRSITVSTVRETVIRIRENKLPDPSVLGNAGSFFMNPIIPCAQYESLLVKWPDMPHYIVDETHVKIPAGWMIERCGWKGRTIGRAGVYDRQALVLVNLGNATAHDIVYLANQIMDSVRKQFGITIYPEVNYI